MLACLAKEPADRPQDALELSDALGAIEGVAWTKEQASDWWRDNPT